MTSARTTADFLVADTIAAISTPPGRSGIGIVRLAGPEALAITRTLVRTEAPLEHARARFGVVLDPGAATFEVATSVDEAIVTAFLAPRSYTGDDMVEIAAHGSPVILEALLRSALAQGARLARPGEFTERAFLSGRLDLTQAEAVHDLIAAQTLDQARTAARQLGGALTRRIAPIKERLLHLLALLEAGMDFASGELDDVDVVPAGQIAEALQSISEPLQLLAGSFRSGHIRRSGASLALIGPPNAGKSSLFNRLLDRDRAIVTPLAGTTRDTLEETFSLGGIPLRLVDTAGLRTEAAVLGGHRPEEAERLGILRSREALADADVILLLHDATAPLTNAESELALEVASRPHLLIRNKVDLPGAEHGWIAGTEGQGSAGEVAVSALTGFGLDTLREALLTRLGTGDAAESGLNNLRQQEAVFDAVQALERAAAANANRVPHEMLLLDLHAALSGLDSLTGATTADDILARIFSTFCIGK